MKDIWEPLSVDWRTSVTYNVVVLLALLDHGGKYSYSLIKIALHLPRFARHWEALIIKSFNILHQHETYYNVLQLIAKGM